MARFLGTAAGRATGGGGGGGGIVGLIGLHQELESFVEFKKDLSNVD